MSKESTSTPDVDVEELTTEATGGGMPQLGGEHAGGAKEEGQGVGSGVDEIPSELEANFRCASATSLCHSHSHLRTLLTSLAACVALQCSTRPFRPSRLCAFFLWLLSQDRLRT